MPRPLSTRARDLQKTANLIAQVGVKLDLLTEHLEMISAYHVSDEIHRFIKKTLDPALDAVEDSLESEFGIRSKTRYG